MNMKFIAGISFASIAAAAFWACGEGNINEMTDDDGIFGLRTPEEWVGLKEQAIKSCEQDELGCKLMYGDYLADPNAPVEEDTPTSSASQGSQNGGTTQSNPSQSDPINIVDQPTITSSATFVDNPDTPTPSSSSVEVVTGLGSCKPAVSPIDKGTSVMWTFTPNPDLPKEMLMKFAQKDAYAWDFGGLTDDGSASGRNSGKVTYAESGKYTASVTVTIDGSAETKVCSELQVNGDPITGCKCAPVGVTGSVNFQKTPDVVWSVTGCTSASLPLTYSWDGGAAGTEESFTKTFKAAAASAAPTLKVGNSDKTEIDVTCDPVKVTEGEEFTIKTAEDKAVFKESGSYAISANLPEGWHNADQTCTVTCNGSSSNYVVTIDEIELSGKAAGNTYVAVQNKMLVSHTVGGYSIPVTVEIAAGDSVACGVNW